MKILGLELAPLSIPLERRLQTFATLQFTFTFLFGGFACLFLFVYLLFTRYYFISVVYFCWLAYDYNTPFRGGRRVNWFREWRIWKHAANFFPMKLIKTCELDTDKNYIMGYHPHGITGVGAFMHFSTEGTHFSEIFPGFKSYLQILKGHFQFPFYREYIMTSGSVPVGKESLEWIMTKCGTGNIAVIIVGGALEALEAHPGKFALNLKRKKGFVKEALRCGASLIPIISFGENDLYAQVPNPPGSLLRKVQIFLTNVFGFSPPVFHGRGVFNYTFGVLPFRKPVYTIVGAPIDVEKVENPTNEQLDSLHQNYMTELENLFEKHKLEYGVDKDVHVTYME